MKFILIQCGMVLLISSINSVNSNEFSERHRLGIHTQVPIQQKSTQCENNIEHDPKSIAIYRKLGCIFANKFYSQGSILDFEGIKNRCVLKDSFYQWANLLKVNLE